jgi:hypothetical protein
MPRSSRSAALAVFCLCAIARWAAAQQVHVQTPLHSTSSNFYEHFNVGWRYQRGNMFFDFNGPALPPFGGYNPNADSRFGIAQRWGNGNFSFNFAAGQGSTRTTTMSAPSVTSLNGVPASFQDVTIRPFVTGLIPVVGGFQMFPVPNFAASPPQVISPLAGKIESLKSQLPNGQMPKRPRDLAPRSSDSDSVDGAAAPVYTSANRNSSAQRGDVSVEEIRRQQSEEDSANQREIDRLCSEARIAEVAGQLGVARVRYRQAATRTSGAQREKLLAAAARLKDNGDQQ